MATTYSARTVYTPVTSRWAQKSLTLVGKVYTPLRPALDGATLIFVHCTASHKETWEPIIERIFTTANDAARRGPRVREAWSFDMPDHGEAGALNHAVVTEGRMGISLEEGADALKAFYASGALAGRDLIAVGHSFGTTCLLLASITDEVPGIPFRAFILVEPAMITRPVFRAHMQEHETSLKAVRYAVGKRKELWRSRAEARAYFEDRYPWQMWDPRTRELFVRHALRDVVVEEKGKSVKRVTLCLPKERETSIYHHDEAYCVALDQLSALGPSFPVHMIFGENQDVVPDYVHAATKGARPTAQLHEVPDAGHAVVQENPDGTAAVIEGILTELCSGSGRRAAARL